MSVLLGLLIASRNIEPGKQFQMVSTLFTIAPVLFGILGVWVAMLDPSVILDQKPTDTQTRRTELALEFSPLLIMATLVFIGIVILQFSEPLLPSEWFEYFWGRAILGMVISFLYLIEILVLIGTLLPLARVQKKRREDLLRRKYRK